MWIYHVIAILTVAIWGSTFISTKVLYDYNLSPAQVFTIRYIIAYVLMLLFSHKHIFAKSVKDELMMVALGLTGGSIFFVAQNIAINLSTTMNVSLIVCSCPLFTMLLYRLVYRNTRLSKMQIIGTILAFVGMAAVVMNGQMVLNLLPLGDSIAVFACVCWAIYSVLLKKANEKYSSAFITRKVFFYGLLTVLPYYAVVPGFPSMSTLLQPVVLYNFLFLGCIASMLCFLSWTWVITKLGVIRVSNYGYANPITTVVLAVWILGEKITPFFVVGTAFILLGLFLSNKNPVKILNKVE